MFPALCSSRPALIIFPRMCDGGRCRWARPSPPGRRRGSADPNLNAIGVPRPDHGNRRRWRPPGARAPRPLPVAGTRHRLDPLRAGPLVRLPPRDPRLLPGQHLRPALLPLAPAERRPHPSVVVPPGPRPRAVPEVRRPAAEGVLRAREGAAAAAGSAGEGDAEGRCVVLRAGRAGRVAGGAVGRDAAHRARPFRAGTARRRRHGHARAPPAR
ncbi:hypothetical protein DFJ74DRAFT_684611 [Hyaloraphidium curvatum]|nr:hypothetical protein DFJ74DRAFT_684611 [Hyaloraphidium curvatum]